MKSFVSTILAISFIIITGLHFADILSMDADDTDLSSTCTFGINAAHATESALQSCPPELDFCMFYLFPDGKRFAQVGRPITVIANPLE
jgi:hypothetical protein